MATLLAEVQALGVNAWAVPADLGLREELETLLPRALAQAGDVQLLVNSASIFPPGSLLEVTFEDLVHDALINAWAPFYLSRELDRLGGPRKIVNILDAWAGTAISGHAAYFISKQMLAEFTRRSAVAFAPEVTVNGIAPGWILPPPGER